VAKVKTHATQHGRLTKVVTVTTDDPVAKTIQLRVSFELEPAVEIKPQPRVFLNVLEGEPGSQRLVLHRTDGEPLQVTKVETGSSKLFDVKVVPVKKADPSVGAVPGDVILDVSVGPRKGYLARSDALVVHTNHPKMESFKLPVSLRVRPLIQATPGQLRLWVGPREQERGASSVLVLRSNAKRPFTITSVASSRPDAVQVVEQNSGSAVQHTLKVTVPAKVAAALDAAMLRARITVTTDDPEKPEIQVPVFVSKRVGAKRRVGRRGPDERKLQPKGFHTLGAGKIRPPAQPRPLRPLPAASPTPPATPAPSPTPGGGE
jgi:hypothetical protein